jgi:hypothetical protein
MTPRRYATAAGSGDLRRGEAIRTAVERVPGVRHHRRLEVSSMHGRSTKAPAPSVPGAEHAPSPGERTTSPGAMVRTPATMPHAPQGGAVVLLAANEAVVARTNADGYDEIARVRRRTRAKGAPSFFLRVMHEVGERSPILILGGAGERTAFEREFVLVSHRPDRLLEDASVHEAHPEALLERLRGLRSHPG